MLLVRPVTWDQLANVQRDGVYDLVSQRNLYGKDICSEIIQDSYGSFSAADPSIRGATCFFTGQSDVDGNECFAADTKSRRFCPCSTVNDPTALPTTASPSTAWPTTASPFSVAPTASTPSSNLVLTVNTPLSVPYYWTSLTSSATVNTVPFTFTVCNAGDIQIADCDPVGCKDGKNDQYIRLYSSGKEIAVNDDAGSMNSSCSYCSVINYRIESDTCQIYTLQQGCFGDNECSGYFKISLTVFAAQLTANTPLHVPYYSTSITHSATVNTVPYTFTVCSKGDIRIADCDSDRCRGDVNDQFIRLYSNGHEVVNNDDASSTCTGLCSAIDYRTDSFYACQTFTLQQGCFDDTTCSGNFTITLTQNEGNTAIYYYFFLFVT